MDKSCHSAGDSAASSISTASASSISSTIIPAAADASARTTTTTTTTTSTTTPTNKDQFLRHLNKLSHKISKPSIAAAAPIRRSPAESSVSLRPPPQPQPGPPLQQQPPVYNINKSDFRDVVQKLTGSPAYDRIQAPAPPPPFHAHKPASSRLQRIRPPPLVQLGNLPPPMLNCAVPPVIPMNPMGGGGFMRQQAPLSPLPPLPTCHAAAESPISAYMRFLRGSISAVDSDPKFNDGVAFNPQQQQPINPPPASVGSFTGLPAPLPFECLPSPKSPCPLLSPKLLLSPTGAGPLGLPLSPTVPGVPSPK